MIQAVNINWQKIEKIKTEDVLYKNLGKLYYENIKQESEEVKDQIKKVIISLNILNT